MDCSMPGLPAVTNSRSLLKLISIESVMPSNHLILCRPLLPSSIFPSIRVFSNESVLRSVGLSIGVSASASVLPPNIQDWFSFRLDLPAVQGTLKSLLQHHSSKASILRCSAFFIVQLSHPDAVIRELLGSGAVKGKHGPLFRTCIQMQAFTLTPEQSRMLPNGS